MRCATNMRFLVKTLTGHVTTPEIIAIKMVKGTLISTLNLISRTVQHPNTELIKWPYTLGLLAMT